MSKIDVVAHIHAKPGNEAELKEILQGFVAPTLKEDGCVHYDLFLDISDPGKFTFIEAWTSTDALEQHGKSSHITAGRARMGPLLREPAWVQVLRPVPA
ncbi:MAG: antibiotic biosynthesis monooxygenase [Acidobacteriia bacterium]|nr:antibiotic biosynthesis monooxygenase [Terriglobia bacterium]